MNDEEAFLRAIAENPDDESCRLVFADWLEERGDSRAEFLRLDCALRRMSGREADYDDVQAHWWALRADLDPVWLAVLGRSEIENCEVRFLFRCPQRWEKLKTTELPMVRFCDWCSQEVFYCGTIDQAKEHACAGHCVAVDVKVTRQPGDLDEEGSEEEFVVALGEPDGEDDMVMGELTEGQFMGLMEFDTDELDSPLGIDPPPPRKKPWWKFW
jgi:uncharacterized protein (TIGR02996 family)